MVCLLMFIYLMFDYKNWCLKLTWQLEGLTFEGSVTPMWLSSCAARLD